KELIRLDLPTFERPRKANSGGPSTGKNWGSAAEVRNLAMGGFICFVATLQTVERLPLTRFFQLLNQAVQRASRPHRSCFQCNNSGIIGPIFTALQEEPVHRRSPCGPVRPGFQRTVRRAV